MKNFKRAFTFFTAIQMGLCLCAAGGEDLGVDGAIRALLARDHSQAETEKAVDDLSRYFINPGWSDVNTEFAPSHAEILNTRPSPRNVTEMTAKRYFGLFQAARAESSYQEKLFEILELHSAPSEQVLQQMIDAFLESPQSDLAYLVSSKIEEFALGNRNAPMTLKKVIEFEKASASLKTPQDIEWKNRHFNDPLVIRVYKFRLKFDSLFAINDFLSGRRDIPSLKEDILNVVDASVMMDTENYISIFNREGDVIEWFRRSYSSNSSKNPERVKKVFEILVSIVGSPELREAQRLQSGRMAYAILEKDWSLLKDDRLYAVLEHVFQHDSSLTMRAVGDDLLTLYLNHATKDFLCRCNLKQRSTAGR